MSIVLPVRVTTPPPKRPGDLLRIAVRSTGEILITVGALLLLLCTYQLWWTNVEASGTERTLSSQIGQSFAAENQGGSISQEVVPAPGPGAGFAFMYIPRLKDMVWAAPVVQGVTKKDLRGAVGHYTQSQMPGQVGNFAVAAHRATNGELFRDIDRLRVGDRVYVETATTWYVYRLQKDKIVTPTQTEVILPVPGKPGATPTRRLITLTTCNPRWASYERWIWWGELETSSPKTQGAPAGLGI